MSLLFEPHRFRTVQHAIEVARAAHHEDLIEMTPDELRHLKSQSDRTAAEGEPMSDDTPTVSYVAGLAWKNAAQAGCEPRWKCHCRASKRRREVHTDDRCQSRLNAEAAQ